MTITEDELYELSYAKEPKRSSVVSFFSAIKTATIEVAEILSL